MKCWGPRACTGACCEWDESGRAEKSELDEAADAERECAGEKWFCSKGREVASMEKAAMHE